MLSLTSAWILPLTDLTICATGNVSTCFVIQDIPFKDVQSAECLEVESDEDDDDETEDEVIINLGELD